MTWFRVPSALAFALAASAAVIIAHGSAHAEGDAQKGKIAFVKYGCWQCHGFNGQGSATSNGKVIARTELPVEAFIAFVRTTNGQMPPYREPILSDADLTNIYAYLQSLPAPKAVNDIPLLNADARAQ